MDPRRRKKHSHRLPQHLAVALRYESNKGKAPEVVASGKGLIADRITQLAEEHGVPVHQDSDLAQLLSEVEVHQQIPEELFEAVAKVLAFVWRVDRRVGANSRKN